MGGGDLNFGTVSNGEFNFNTGDVNIEKDIDLTGNFTGNQIYGELWNHSESGFIVTIIAADTYANVSGSTTAICGLNNGFVCSNGELITQVAGVYDVNFDFSFNGANGDEIHPSIGINGANQAKCHQVRDSGSAAANGNAGGGCYLYLNVGDIVTFMIENDQDGDDVTIKDFNLRLSRIGNN